jgi:hypothetical protein
MATYAGGSISTGKLIVNGNITLDPSGGNAASFNAVNISATTVNSTTITTDTIIFNSIDVSSNLLVNGNMVVDGSATFLAPLTANRISTPGGFVVDVSANVTAFNVTSNVTGNVTGNLSGNVTGNLIGNVTGDILGDVSGNVTGNLIGNVTGDILGDVSGNVTGNLIGNVTGDILGDVSGNVTGNVTGNLIGNVLGDVSGNVTGNVTVPNGASFNCTGLNNYTGNYQIGDLISYNNPITNIGGSTTVTTTVSDQYFNYWYAEYGISAFYSSTNNAKTNVNVYQIAYWGLDTRTSQPTRLSATIIVPVIQISSTSTIVSYKHASLLSYNGATLVNGINTARAGVLTANPALQPLAEFTPWQIANQGYIVVVADNLSYGKSTGFYPYHDPQSEAMSQYAAVVATTQLMTLVPSLFSAPLCNNFTIPATVPVISTGYSLGGQYCATVSQLIRNSSLLTGSTTVNTNPNSKPLLLKNTIAGAPTNVYKINETIFEGSTGLNPNISLPTNWLVTTLLGEGLAGNPNYANVSGFTQTYLQQVAPVFTYIQDAATAAGLFPVIPDPSSGVVTAGVGNVIQGLTYTAAKAYATARRAGLPVNNGPLSFLGTDGYVLPTTHAWGGGGLYNDTSAGFVIPSAIYDYSGDTSHNFAMDFLKQQTFYTNPFIDFTDLSGQSINTLYSVNDELACYDTSHCNWGSSGKDNVETDLSGFVAKITPAAGFAGSVNYTFTDASANVAQLVLNEFGAAPCQTSRWDLSPINPPYGFQHNPFAYTFWPNVMCGYMLARAGAGL